LLNLPPVVEATVILAPRTLLRIPGEILTGDVVMVAVIRR